MVSVARLQCDSHFYMVLVPGVEALCLVDCLVYDPLIDIGHHPQDELLPIGLVCIGRTTWPGGRNYFVALLEVDAFVFILQKHERVHRRRRAASFGRNSSPHSGIWSLRRYNIGLLMV